MALNISYPDLSAHPSFDDHETVLLAQDPEIDFKAYIALHNTVRGPARGGCRYWSSYPDEAAAQRDVLRLSRGMTFKTTLANLPFGGGKTVIIGKPGTKNPTPEIMRALGHALNELNGAYETGEDVGTRTSDFKIAGEVTEHVRIRAVERAGAQDLPGGPPLYTARGVYHGMKAAVKHKFGQDDFKDIRVAVKGLGNVGYPLCERLHQQGAILTITDIDEEKARNAAQQWGATMAAPEDIIYADVDVYSPCALGGDINDDTIGKIKARIIAGAANNQLAERRHAQELYEQGILYAPDYAINAGGVIDVVLIGYSHDDVMQRVRGIGDTLNEIFVRSDEEGQNTSVIADTIVQERLDAALKKTVKICA